MSDTEHAALSAEAVLSVPDHVLVRHVEGETVLLNLDDEQYYGLDGVGARVYELIDEPTRFGDLIARLVDEYDVDVEVLTTDLRELVGDLADSRLVDVDAP